MRKVPPGPELTPDWEGPVWRDTASLDVAHFLAGGSTHRPCTRAKMVYSDAGLHGLFQVEDRYVACTHTEYLSPVYRDSCVEFFVKPKPGKGYMNFEMNCGGSLLLYYIENATRKKNPNDPDDEFAAFRRVPWDVARAVAIRTSLPPIVSPEIQEPLTWQLAFFIPFTVIEAHAGPLGDPRDQTWRANFNKCADDSSHPHWATWSPLGDELNLHQPDRFGHLRFT